jgi:hypothetical protein
VADQTCFALLVQHEDEKEIGLMILKTYLWRKHGDEDYIAPKIQIINKDIFSYNKIELKTIIEAISLKD